MAECKTFLVIIHRIKKAVVHRIKRVVVINLLFSLQQHVMYVCINEYIATY